jgi:hypothetical protein
VGKTPELDNMTVAKNLIASAAHLLASWPNNFWTLLQRMQVERGRDPSLYRTFDPLYKVLYALLPGAVYQFARDAFEDYLREHWWGLVCERNRRLKPSTRAQHPRLSIAQAASHFEATPTTVKRLVEAQLVDSAVAIHPSGRKATSVLFDEMESLQDDINGSLTLGEAACRLHLSEARTRQLIAHGLLATLSGCSTRGDYARWMIPLRGVNRLFFACNAQDPGQVSTSVREVFKRWHLSAHEVASFVRDLQNGLLNVFGPTTGLVPLGAVLLSLPDVLAWREQFNWASTECLSIPQAALVMQLKQQVVYDLVAVGLLPHRRGQHGERLVERKAIGHFQRTYVTLAALANSVNRSARSLLKELDSRPVTGPCIDATRQYFYRRMEVAAELGKNGGGLLEVVRESYSKERISKEGMND